MPTKRTNERCTGEPKCPAHNAVDLCRRQHLHAYPRAQDRNTSEGAFCGACIGRRIANGPNQKTFCWRKLAHLRNKWCRCFTRPAYAVFYHTACEEVDKMQLFLKFADLISAKLGLDYRYLRGLLEQSLEGDLLRCISSI